MKKFREMLKDNAAFTLVELIVVIAVLGILAGIAVPRLTGVQDSANISAGKSALRSIDNALQMYYAENSEYPSDFSTLEGSDYLGSSIIPDGWDSVSFTSETGNTASDTYPVTISAPSETTYTYTDSDGTESQIDSLELDSNGNIAPPSGSEG